MKVSKMYQEQLQALFQTYIKEFATTYNVE